ncbi:SMP-30/gluconolactonase/LRE family protein [Cytophagaceae bacterium ABcell3]|nr:SMP-30/gluconolactonase/LRE family protein [Cytophagaceae bacterium ABcell3]
MKKYIKIAVVALFASCSGASLEKEQEIDGFALPEGVVQHEKYLYVSNVGKKFEPLEKDGDGFISKMNEDGDVIDMHYLPLNDTLHSPKGMGVVNNVLYVTDIDRLKGFDLTTREKVFDLDFSREKTLLLNDIAVKNDSALFVSAMDIGKIYEVDLTSKSYRVIQEVQKPNGLSWDAEEHILYVGMFGREDNANGNNGDLGMITFAGDAVLYEEISSYQGNIDGVAIDNGHVLFSDWLAYGDKGGIKMLDLATGEIKAISDHKIDGPGDFFYNPISKKLWIPKMKENKILVIDLD